MSSLYSDSAENSENELFLIDIFTAASVGDVEAVDLLISSGIDPNGFNTGGWTPLMYAAYVGHEKVCKLLFDRRAQLETASGTVGQTALMLAASCGNEKICQLLVTHGSDVNTRDKNGLSALVYAASNNHTHLVKFLLKKGASSNQILDDTRNTPFLLACADGNNLVVQTYIESGADIDWKTTNGETGKDIALRYNHKQIYNILNRPKTSAHNGLDRTVSGPATSGKGNFVLGLPRVSTDHRKGHQPTTSTPNGSVLEMRKTLSCRPLIAEQTNQSIKSLADLFDQLQLSKYTQVFERQEIDLQLFLQMTDSDLKEIGITLFGPRKKMINAINRWHEKSVPGCDDKMRANYHKALSEEFTRKNMALNQELTLAQETTEHYKQEVQRMENRLVNAVASARLCNNYVKESKRQTQSMLLDVRRSASADLRQLEQGLCRISALCDQTVLKLAEGGLV